MIECISVIQDAAASLTVSGAEHQCPSASAAGTATWRSSVKQHPCQVASGLCLVKSYLHATLWTFDVVCFLYASWCVHFSWNPVSSCKLCEWNNTEDMIDEATLVLQRWKESDSLPSGMVFDAEHLDTTSEGFGCGVNSALVSWGVQMHLFMYEKTGANRIQHQYTSIHSILNCHFQHRFLAFRLPTSPFSNMASLVRFPKRSCIMGAMNLAGILLRLGRCLDFRSLGSRSNPGFHSDFSFGDQRKLQKLKLSILSQFDMFRRLSVTYIIYRNYTMLYKVMQSRLDAGYLQEVSR